MESSRTSQFEKGLSPPRLIAGQATSWLFAFAAVHNLGHASRSVSGVYEVAANAIWLGIVEAPDKQAAIEKDAKEFKTGAWHLYAVAKRSKSAAERSK
jgi:hypothetical protein